MIIRKTTRRTTSMGIEFAQECDTDWLCWLGMPLEYDGYVVRDIPTYEERIRLYKVFRAGSGKRQ